MINKLFVYGTLCPGRSNAHILEEIGGTFEQGYVRGILYPEGWGASYGYPALVPDPDGELVKGFMFTSQNLPNHWPGLDAFEGEGYERVLVEVELLDGKIEIGFIYALNRQA